MDRQPTWWNDAQMTAWDRVKEAMRRDWQQTKHDIGMKSGHYLHQNAEDTVKQVRPSAATKRRRGRNHEKHEIHEIEKDTKRTEASESPERSNNIQS